MTPRALILVPLLIASTAFGADEFDAAAAKAAAEYSQRLEEAARELTAVRQRITDEKAPMLRALRAAEDRIVAAESESTRIEREQEESKDRRRELQKEHDAVLKNLSYISNLAREAAAAIQEALPPGEEQDLGDQLRQVLQQFDEVPKVSPETATMTALHLMVDRIERSIGGYRMPGSAILSTNNELVEGTYAFAGPDTFFRTGDGKAFGIARSREGAPYPVLHLVAEWKAEDADAFFEGKPGMMVADTTGGKALRLQQTRGSLLEHVQRGGVVSFAILFVGVLALVLIASKVRDLLSLQVDAPEKFHAFLRRLGTESAEPRDEMLAGLSTTTRELLSTGIEYISLPKELLEEHLWAVLLRMRLHYERRLPLLAIIAVAAPLMGLLGTVTGMVKTFALITVFGTGNAGKLASGISEVLVATELGLIVAIPALVAHGFLADRIQKKLSLLERYALEFTTKAQLRADAEKPLVGLS